MIVKRMRIVRMMMMMMMMMMRGKAEHTALKDDEKGKAKNSRIIKR